MSSAVAYPRPQAPPAGPGGNEPAARPRGAWRLQALSILGFSILGLLAGQRFVSLLVHPSFIRVAAIGVVAAAWPPGCC